MSNAYAQCAKCPLPLQQRACFVSGGKGPAFCPTLAHKKTAQQAFDSTDAKEHRLVCASIRQEAAGYHRGNDYTQIMPSKPRIVEIIEFSQRMGYKRLGLIFCTGSRNEAKIIQEILIVNGFEVVSVTCKVGQIPKTDYGVGIDQLLNCDNHQESSCNPKLQAVLANEAEIDFAILLNLCVGHDSILIKHIDAPVTVFSVKDRLLGHYPLLAIYQYDSYYRYLKYPLPVCAPEDDASTTQPVNGDRS